MKNNKGFATSGVLYTLLLLFVALLFGVLQNLQDKKTILDTLKTETVTALACDCVQMQDQINDIQSKVNNDWISLGTVTGMNQITFPEEYSELLIYVRRTSDSAYSSTQYILKSMLTETPVSFIGGAGQDGNGWDNRYNLDVSVDHCNLTNVWNKMNVVTTSFSLTVYYRK